MEIYTHMHTQSYKYYYEAGTFFYNEKNIYI